MIAVPPPVMLFVAGLTTSVGPCVAPRFLAAATFAADDEDQRGRLRVAALFFGIVAGYITLGMFSSAIAQMTRYSTVVYAILATVLIAFGLRSLFSHGERCSHSLTARRSAGGAFLLGLSSVVVISPCCAPMVGAIGAFTLGEQSVAQTCTLVGCFAMGHALPVLLAGWGLRSASVLTGITRTQKALRFAGATLTIALGGYFAVLA